MKVCLKCGSIILFDYSHCAVCGTDTTNKVPISSAGEQVDSSISHFSNFIHDNFGLAKTFWFYGVLGSIAVAFLFIALINISQSFIISLVGLLLFWLWQITVSVAIWQAAIYYPKYLFFSILARLIIIASLCNLAYITGQIFNLV